MLINARLEPRVVAIPVCLALAMLGAAATGIEPRLFVILPAFAVVAALLASSTARLAFVVVGGTVVLGSSQDLDVTKLAYLAGVGVAVIGASLNLASRELALQRRLWVPLAISSFVWLGVLVMSLVVATSNGIGVFAWMRDGLNYALFASIPLIAVDASTSKRRGVIGLVLLTAGALTAASFGVKFVAGHGLGDFGLGGLALVSYSLPAALLCYATAASVSNVRSWAIWALAATGVAAIILATGTRSAATLLVGSAVILLVARRLGPERARPGRAVLALALAACITLPLTVAVANVDVSSLLQRFGSIGDLVNHPALDQSYAERVYQTSIDAEAFAQNPLFGVGPGRVISYVPIYSADVKEVVEADSPLGVPAKFGLLGVFALMVSAAAFVLVTRALPRGVPRLALAGFLMLALVRQLYATPLEEKGFSFGLLLLLALALFHAASPRPATVPDS